MEALDLRARVKTEDERDERQANPCGPRDCIPPLVPPISHAKVPASGKP